MRSPQRRASVLLSSASLAASLIGAGAFTAACQPSAGSPANAGPHPTASASLEAPHLRRCQPEEPRCLSDAEVEACSEDGQQRVKKACDGASICLAGRCTPLRTSTPKREAVIPREALFRVEGEGWLSGWSIAGPLRGGESKAIADDPSSAFEGRAPGGAPSPGVTAGNAPLPLRAACGPSGSVPVFDRLKEKATAPEVVALAGYLVSPSVQKVQLRTGFGGSLRAFVNGKPTLDAARSAGSRPFKDEVIVDAELAAGVNPIVILAERGGDGAAGLWVRVRGQDGLPARDLRFAQGSPSAACSAADLAQVRFAKTPIAGGFSIDITLNYAGLTPSAPAPLEAPFKVEARREGKPAVELGSGALRLGDSAAAARTTVTLKPEARGSYDVELTVGSAGAAGAAGAATAPGAPSPLGEVKAREKVVFRGALHDKIVDLSRRIGALAPGGALPRASVESATYNVQSLVRDVTDGHPDESWIASRAKDAEAVVKALEQGRDPYPEKKGLVRRAYRSELDGELQPYTIVVPPSYRADKAMPLIITFHGLESQPEHALRAVIGQATKKEEDSGYTGRHLPEFPDYGVLLAAPWGYGKSGPRQLGEHDVLRVVEEMRANYKVDDRRISITGASLGGTVSFVVPLHYPDLFSASAPLCGYPNLMTYQSVRTTAHAPWEETLLAKRYIGNYAENGLYLPLNIVHGGLDGPERSRVIAERYKELGYSYTFDVQDDLDHNVWDYAYEDGQMVAWLKARRRPEAPSRARLVTGEYRYSKAYWVRLIAMQDDTKLCEIDARWRKKEGEARVTTKNVSAFALDLSAFKVPDGAKAVIDGQAIALPEGAGKVFFARPPEGGAFARAPEEPSREGKKRPGVSGPLDDALRHPLVIVYGTQDPAQIEANRMVAEHASSYDTWAYAHFPILADSEATEEALAGKSLMLIGGPSSNKVTASIIDKLPLRFEPNAVVVRGKRYEGSDVGVSMIYPRPGVESEYVVVHAGVTARGTLASRHLPQLVPDYLVYDGRITVQRGDLLLDKRTALDGGFFDQDWK